MNKHLYHISAVANLVGVPAHTIRYWEKEFSAFLNPARPNGGHRRYGSYDVEVIRRIKAMLKEEKYSIAGARQKLQNQLIGKTGNAQEIPLHDQTLPREQTVLVA